MTRRLRVRPSALRVLAAILVATLAPAPVARAAGDQQSRDLPYRDAAPVEDSRDWSDEIPAHISVVDGAAELERDGQREAAEENVPLLAGDRLRTARGRVEVLFSDGSALALDHGTDVDFLSDSLLRVQAGRLRLAIARGGSDLAYRVDAADTTTWLRTAGEYRIVVDNRSAESDVFVTVMRGAAELESAGGRTLIRTGFEARANARNEPSLPYTTNVASADTFERWVDEQQRYRTGARSAQYLPTELRHYGGAFDRDGGWEFEQGYGYVWYPTVAADWRPYYDGGWSHVGAFGWTWVGGGRWTWPTHHYGRWGLRTGRWFWIPGRRWAPAWVSWASAPGYLGWCPLGFDNRPVISITNINVYGRDRRYGWTVLPSNRFGSRVAVSRWAVAPHSLNLTGDRFSVHANSPIRPSIATRQVEPLRAPKYSGRYAVPRSRATSTVSGGSGPSSSQRADSRTSASRDPMPGSAGRPSNPVTRPSGPDADDGNGSGRTSTVRTAGPRPRSNPSASRDSNSDSAGSDRSGPERSATPRSRTNPSPTPAPQAGSGSGPSSGSGESSGRATGRRRSMSSSPAPLPSERIFNRRSSASPYESAPAPRRDTPSYDRVPRIERSAPMRQAPVERSAPSRSIRSAPERSMPMRSPQVQRAPQVERSTPGRASGVERSSPSSAPSSHDRGQARSRNR